LHSRLCMSVSTPEVGTIVLGVAKLNIFRTRQTNGGQE